MAAPSRKKFIVKVGTASLTVVPWKKAWRYWWRESENAPWNFVSAKTKEKITELAEKTLRDLGVGGVVWSSLPRERLHFLETVHKAVAPEDQAAVLEFIESRKKSALVPEVVARFMAFKVGTKAETPHLKMVRRDLEDFAAKHATKQLVDVTEDELAEWWNARTGTAGDDRRKGVRGNLVMLYRWAHTRGMAGREAKSLAEQLPQVESTKGKLEIFYLPELEYLLSIVEKDWFPLIVFGAFQGIRPEELAPKKDNPKPRLRWENIDWEFNSITVPAEVSKTRGKVGRARTLPLHPVTRAWLEAYGAGPTWTGEICKGSPTECYKKGDRLTAAWGKALAERFPDRFTGWPQDALRHSYGSYRIATVRSTAQVALEMGNSEDMLHGYYNNPRPLHEGAAFFNFMPATAAVLPAYLKVA